MKVKMEIYSSCNNKSSFEFMRFIYRVSIFFLLHSLCSFVINLTDSHYTWVKMFSWMRNFWVCWVCVRDMIKMEISSTHHILRVIKLKLIWIEVMVSLYSIKSCTKCVKRDTKNVAAISMKIKSSRLWICSKITNVF